MSKWLVHPTPFRSERDGDDPSGQRGAVQFSALPRITPTGDIADSDRRTSRPEHARAVRDRPGRVRWDVKGAARSLGRAALARATDRTQNAVTAAIGK
jgi:hypothetical protein